MINEDQQLIGEIITNQVLEGVIDDVQNSEGIAFPRGPKGATGDTGASITSAAFVAADLVFTKDDTTTVTLVNGKTDLKGDQGEKGDKGETGSTGVQGIQGIQGVEGNGIASITKTSTVGLVDTYTITYDDNTTTTFDVTNGAAGADGIDGTNGTDGDDGADGATWYTGSGAPSAGTGVDNDLYLNTANGDVYKKVSSSWGSAIANITGPQGIQGETGLQGTAGTNGTNGTNGVDGTDINWEGAYVAGTTYVVNDAVSYEGSSYICKLQSTGNLPTNATYFDLMAQKGDTSEYTLPTASTTTLGGVKVDGTSISITDGVISGSSSYTLPAATTDNLGGVKLSEFIGLDASSKLNPNIHTYYWDGLSSASNSANIALFQKIVDDDTNSIPFTLYGKYTNGSWYVLKKNNPSSTNFGVITDAIGVSTSNTTSISEVVWGYFASYATLSSGTVTAVAALTYYEGTTSSKFLKTDRDYATPYTPLYNGSPATKKYVDDGLLLKINEPASEGTNGQALTTNGSGARTWATIGGGTDEKVKYDANDTTAGYVADKIIAGTGISVAEGTGANENKLVITNSTTQYTDELAQDAVGSMVDTTLTYIDGTPELKVTNPVTPQATGFTITAGTTAKTLTVAETASVSGTNTGDQDLSSYATLTGAETITNKDLTATSNKLFKTGTIATAAATAAKTVTLDSPDASYTPASGDLFLFTYTSGQTASSATIAVNGGAAKNVRLGNATANNIGHTTAAGGSLLYSYDGTYFQLIGSQQQINTSTTYIESTTGTAVIGSTQTCAVNNLYYANNATTVAFTLPATCALNSVVEIVGLHATGTWSVIAPAGDNIIINGNDTGAAGTLTGVVRSTVKLRCIVANTTWEVVTYTGTITTNTGYSTLVKATGAEINTGTDDAKFVTAKAIVDSTIPNSTIDNLTSTSTTDALSANQGKVLNDTIVGGWITTTETWLYVSVDDPTGVIKVNADVTTKYSLGMRIKFTNGGNIIYGIFTKIGTYGANEAGYTYLYFLHEINPATSTALYLMANSAITANYYSNMKAPFGFPLTATKWRIIYTENTIVKQATPTGFTWYNVGTKLKEIPIGGWEILLNFVSQNGISSGSYANRVINTCLSTTNNSDAYTNLVGGALVGNYIRFSGTIRETREFASKTILYVNLMSDTNVDEMYSIGCKITATCAYL